METINTKLQTIGIEEETPECQTEDKFIGFATEDTRKGDIVQIAMNGCYAISGSSVIPADSDVRWCKA